jgi:DNA-binding MarR family transcriptional regulator
VPREHYSVDSYRPRRSVGYLVKRLYNLMLPEVEALFANEELTFSQWCALMGLRDGLVSTSADIARHLSQDTGATTRMVDQLEARGYLVRRRSRDDRRVIDLSLTPAGRKVVHSLSPHLVTFWNAMLAEFTADEFATLISLLQRLVDRVEEHAERDVPAQKQAAR